jgi:hypothetical protein
LTNERYGKGLDVSLIDDTAISAAADFYDTTVTFYTGGTTGKVFEFNAIVDTEQSILDNLKDMMLCCRGFMPYTNGIYQLIPDKSSSSVFAFDTDNIISGISIRGENKADKYNRMVCTFTDPTNNYQENTVIWPEAGSTEEIAFLLEDNGTELIGEIDLPYITNFYAARDLARVFLLRSRNAIRTSFNANSDALNVSVGDVVTVTHPTPAWSAKPFQVEEVAINYDGTCTVALIEYDSSIYSYDPASEQLAYADTDLPNPFAVAAPTSLVVTESTLLSEDGTVVREIDLAWTAADDAFVESYELQFKLSAATDYFSVFTFEPRYIATYGAVGEVYDYRIRAINSLGVSSAFLTGTYTTVGDTTAPAIPASVTITGDYNQVTATWTAATEKDYKESWVYENTTGVTPDLNPAINAPFRKVTGNTVTASGLTPSTTYYVWVRNVDFSDNRSGFSSPGTFTTTAGSSAVAVVAGGTIAGSVTTDAVQISTIRTNAATGSTHAGVTGNPHSTDLSQITGDLDDIANGSTFFKTTANDVSGAVRGFNALDASYNYVRGLSTTRIVVSEANPTNGVVIDSGGVRGYGSSVNTFNLNASNGSLSLTGTLSAGSIIAGSVTVSGVTLDTTRLAAAAALPTASFDTTLDASLAAGVGYVISGEGGDYRLNVGASSIVAKHKDASEAGVAAYTGNVRTGLIITANGIAMGYNALSGAWVTAVAIDSTGNASLKGSLSVADLTAGTINAEITSTNNVILSTAGKIYTAGKTSAASTTAGVFLGHDGSSNYDFAVGDGTKSIVWDGSAGTLTVTGDIIANGNIQDNAVNANKIANNAITAGKILAGEITGDKISSTFTTTSNLVLTTAGKLYTSGKTSAASTTAGVFLGHDGGSNYDFAVGDGTKSIVWDGSAGTFTITNVNLITSGQMKATGQTTEGLETASIIAAPTATLTNGVYAKTIHNSAAVYGENSSGGSGILGVTYGTGGHGVSGLSTAAGLYGIYAFNSAGGGAFKSDGRADFDGDIIMTGATKNLVIGNATNTGNSNLVIKEGVAGSRLDNQMIVYGALSTDADTTLGIITEQDVVAGTGAFAGILQIRIVWNGAEYWLPLQAV